MRAPDLVNEFYYKGHINVEYWDILNKEDIPDIAWNQVYVIGEYTGKVPVVTYADARSNLPGGGVEADETLEQAMQRELEEELNMTAISWQPLGFQKCVRRETGKVSYQFRAYAKLRKLGDFIEDPGGSVTGHDLVGLDELNDVIGYGNVGERLVENARQYFGTNSGS